MKQKPRDITLVKQKVSHTEGGKYLLWNCYTVYWIWNCNIL